ncbi:PAS domain-containing protein [Polyangium aurulentum]|uniref:PAS domain-containing protein n=1 Tax=Polyangium aurulentum TaxID=2567896 RepID=UPI00146AC896|nr:PAS domain-containing protein [Polyangium aurulentum]UQA63148.1 PAS domain-containing protein [Polyangium aurulentum]
MSGALRRLHSNDNEYAPPGAAAETARLRAEVDALRRRVVELETAWTAALSPTPITPEDGGSFTGASELLDESRAILGAMLAHGPTVVFVKDVSGRYALINRHFSALFDATPTAVLGKTDYDLFPPEVAARIRKTDQDILVEGRAHEYEGTIPTPRGERTFSTLKVPVYDRRGDVLGLACFSSDITELRRAEAERDEMERLAGEAREATLRELEAPLMPIARGVLAIPLVGELGEARARHVEAVVLSGVTERQVEWVILDVTGLRTAGAAAICGLSRVARAARLLGASVVVTGMRAELARTLGAMDEGKPEFISLSTLESGIEYTLRRRRRK